MTQPTFTLGQEKEKRLPGFRQDLKLYPGPLEADGSPTYSLYDPVRGQFFRVTWTESLIFKLLRPKMTVQELIAAIEKNSTLKVTPEEIMLFFQEAETNNLLDIKRTAEMITQKAERLKTGVIKWLLYHYLYIRVPILNPDKFLTKTLKYVMPLSSTPALCIYFTLVIIGLFLIVTRFDDFLHTFPYFFTFQGAIAYGVGISTVKIIHEFSHAYTAKYYKLYVPTMGVAFIVFWPVLYTDVTEGWKLANRTHRIMISVAGIVAELTLAGMSTLAWALTEPGLLNSIFFVVSSITWISTVIVNLNPALRFDGYYIFSDLWGIDNLQPRSFAITRWQLRKWLFGINVAPPEETFSPKKRLWLMIYSFYTWIYRLFLYTAIAIFVYKQFTKLLGVFLFFVEIVVFILWPIASEVNQINKLKAHLTINKRSVITSTILGLFLLWLIIPFPHQESFPATTIPHRNSYQTLYVPYDSFIKKINVKRDQHVEQGEVLLELFSPNLLVDIASNETDLAIIDREMVAASQSQEDKAELAAKEAEYQEIKEKIGGLEKIKTDLDLKAEIAGTLYEWDENLKPDVAVTRDQILGRIANLNELQAIAFIPETSISEYKEGQQVTYRRSNDFAEIKGTIEKIYPLRSAILIYPQLASVNHGDLPVSETQKGEEKKQHQYILVESYYVAIVDLAQPTNKFRIGEVGYVDIQGPWRSYLSIFWRKVQSLLWQEGSP